MWASYKERYDTLLSSTSQSTSSSSSTTESERTRAFPGLKAVLSKKGPLLLREAEKKEDTQFFGWPTGISFQDLTEEQAIQFVEQYEAKQMGQQLGVWNDAQILKKSGKFGDYIQCGDVNITFQEGETVEQIQTRLEQKQTKQTTPPLKKFKEYEVRNGQYGPYIIKLTLKTPKFVSVPKGMAIDTLTEKDVDGLYKAGLENKKNYSKANDQATSKAVATNKNKTNK